MLAHPVVEDREGNLVNPLRYWLWRLGGRREKFLQALAYVDFDWVMAAALRGVGDADAAYDYTRESLRRLHRLMYADGQPNEPRRPKLGECAEPGCPNQTTRLRCREHERA